MITKAPCNKGNFGDSLVYTNSARDAWSLILDTVRDRQQKLSVLLPAYIGYTEREGSGIFDPIQATQAEFSFYRLNRNLDINIKALEIQIKSGCYNVLLVVHYFGFCKNDLNLIRTLCDANEVILVEDCAHAFQLGYKRQQLGVTGDFSFYSVHKYLPVKSGGILKVNSTILHVNEHAAVSFIPDVILKELFCYHYDDIARIRRKNFHSYYAQLKDVDGLELMYELAEHEIPQSFPIRIKEGKREKLYFWLMEQGVPTIALYYRMIDAIKAEDHPLAHTLSFEILNLPLHQDTTIADIEIVCSLIKKFLNNEA